MILYTLNNFYLSSLQQGLQTSHSVVEMFVKYAPHSSSEQFDTLIRWAENHKTIVMLNGGNNQTLVERIDRLANAQHAYPWAYFVEDKESLNNSLTSVAIIMPSIECEIIQEFRNNDFTIADCVQYKQGKITPFMIEICDYLASCRLAQ